MSRPKSCSFCGRMTFGAGLLIEGDANVRARICRACALKCLNLFDRRETEAHDVALSHVGRPDGRRDIGGPRGDAGMTTDDD